MEEAAGFLKLAVVALIAAVRAMQLVLARDGTTGQPVTDAVAAADMAALETAPQRHAGRSHCEAQKPARRHASRLGARLDRRTTGRMVRVIPRADTSRPDQRPCIMGSSRPTRSCSAGTWQIVPQMCDSRSPQGEGVDRYRRRLGLMTGSETTPVGGAGGRLRRSSS